MKKFIYLFLIFILCFSVYSVDNDMGDDDCENDIAKCLDSDPLRAMELDIDAATATEENAKKCMAINPIKVMQEYPKRGMAANPQAATQYVMNNDPNLMNDPEIMNGVFNHNPEDGVKILDKNVDLLDNSDVQVRFEGEMEKDIELINNNLAAKEKWFSNHGITDQGSYLKSYSGGIVETYGIDTTSFDIKNPFFNEAIVTKEGGLILKDGSTISSADIEYVGGGMTLTSKEKNHPASIFLSRDHHNIDLITIKSGVIEFGGKSYSSEWDEFNIEFGKDNYVISGKNVDEYDLFTKGKLFTYSGEVTIDDYGNKKLGVDTDVTKYLSDGSNFKFSVSKETFYYTDGKRCSDEKISCIEESFFDTTDERYQPFILLKNIGSSMGDDALKDFVRNEINKIEDSNIKFDEEGYNDDGNVKLINELILNGVKDIDTGSWSKSELDRITNQYDLYDQVAINDDENYKILMELDKLNKDPDFEFKSWLDGKDKSLSIVKKLDSETDGGDFYTYFDVNGFIEKKSVEIKIVHIDDGKFDAMSTQEKDFFNLAYVERGEKHSFEDVLLNYKSDYTSIDRASLMEDPSYIIFNDINSKLSKNFFKITPDFNLNEYIGYVESKHNFNIVAKEDNSISLLSNTNKINSVNVDSISDDSKVKIKEGGAELLFSNEPVKSKGLINHISIKSISGDLIDENGDLNTILIENGIINWDKTQKGTFSGSKFIPDAGYFKSKKIIGDKWGTAPMGVIGFIDEDYLGYETDLLNDLVSTADENGLDRELFIMSFMQEGGGSQLKENGGVYDSGAIVDTYGSLGVDTLINEMDILIEKGYLPEDYKDRIIREKPAVENEAGLKVRVADLKMEDIIIGMGALLKDKVEYATSGGDNYYSQLSKDDQLWVQYAAYNAGQGKLKQMLTGEKFSWGKDSQGNTIYHPPFKSPEELTAFIHKYEGKEAPGKAGQINSGLHFNAGRTVGGAQVLKEYLDIDKLLANVDPPIDYNYQMVVSNLD